MTSIDWTSDAMGSGGYGAVNGINGYYETHGSGRPMILLHGGLASSEMFGPVLPTLADHHQVIAVDLQGHGPPTSTDPSISGSLPRISPPSSTISGWIGRTWWATRSAAAGRSSSR